MQNVIYERFAFYFKTQAGMKITTFQSMLNDAFWAIRIVFFIGLVCRILLLDFAVSWRHALFDNCGVKKPRGNEQLLVN